MESCCFLRLLFNIPIKETQILKLPKILYQRISLNNCKIPVQDKTKHVYSSQFTIGSLLSGQTTLSNKKIYAPLSSKTLLTSIQPCLYVAKVGLKYHANHQRYLVKEIKHNDSSRLGRRSDVIKRVRRVLIDKKIKLNQTEERWKRNEVIKDVRRVIQDKKIKFHQTEERWKINSRLILDDIKETRSKMKTKMEEIIERENIWTVPNLLCVSRIAISPYLGYLILEQEFTLALGVLTFAGITDLLDGWIARTFKNQSSKLGSFLDPMADKILVATMFLTLTYADIIPVPLTCLIITRDVFLVGAGFVIRYKSLPPPRTLSRYFDVTHATAQLAPTTISKVNTTVQLVTVASTLAAPVFDYLHHPALVTLWYVAAGTTVASAASYILSKNTFKFLKNKKAS